MDPQALHLIRSVQYNAYPAQVPVQEFDAAKQQITQEICLDSHQQARERTGFVIFHAGEGAPHPQ